MEGVANLSMYYRFEGAGDEAKEMCALNAETGAANKTRKENSLKLQKEDKRRDMTRLEFDTPR
jgi:hypothetical protein